MIKKLFKALGYFDRALKNFDTVVACSMDGLVVMFDTDESIIIDGKYLNNEELTALAIGIYTLVEQDILNFNIITEEDL